MSKTSRNQLEHHWNMTFKDELEVFKKYWVEYVTSFAAKKLNCI